MLSGHSLGTYYRKELTSNSPGLARNVQQQSSQLPEPLWIDSGVREQISTQKKKKKSAGAYLFIKNLPQNPRMRGKSHH